MSYPGPSWPSAMRELYSESLVFTRNYSPVNRTVLAMPGVMTSRCANIVGEHIAPAAQTLADSLHKAGYRTVGISTNPYVSPTYGYARGFDRFDSPDQSPPLLAASLVRAAAILAPQWPYAPVLQRAGLYYEDISTVRARAQRALRARASDRPLFLYLHTMDVHGPYLPPERFLPPDYDPAAFYSYFSFLRLTGRGILRSEAFSSRLRNLTQRYDGEVDYTVSELARLIADLRAAGVWGDALVWRLADHGEAPG